MRKFLPFLAGCFFVVASISGQAQNWSGILNPTSGSGACTGTGNGQQCAIDWSASGIPGGIPNTRTQCGSTIQASSYGNGSVDATSAIQKALNSCGANQYVLLGSGTFEVNSYVSIPSNVTLRGAGTQGTFLECYGTSPYCIAMGTGGNANTPPASGVSITGGATAGSTSITVSSASGISVGGYIELTELNDTSYVTNTTTNGTCTWCDVWGGTRLRGQIVEVTSVNGASIGISPALYTAYSHSPLATYFASQVKYAGLEDLQIVATNSNNADSGSRQANISMEMCAYCWVKGIESNMADADHLDAYYSYRGEVRDSYFTGGFVHHSGSTDTDLVLAGKTTGFLVENNIFERLHVGGPMFEWGSAGNVYAYNFDIGHYDDTGSPNINHITMSSIDMHGAHPQFNLWEGNVGVKIDADGFWGSSSHNTAFRNWFKGTTPIAAYSDGSYVYASGIQTTRKAINWAGAFYPNQSNHTINIAYVHRSYNIVGNVLGSAELATVDGMFSGGPAACTACLVSPATRQYQGTFYAFAFGYGTTGDGTGQCSSPASSCPSYATTFIHGNYTTSANKIDWNVNGNGSQTLPPSFYKSSKPSWWGSSIPWPAIGPDVTTGDGPGGHAYRTSSNPAQACYNSTAKDASGILLFDPTTCYGSGSSSTPPGAPTGLTAVAQ